MGHESDLASARALLAGDKQAFDAFFGEYFPRLYRFALTRVDEQEVAEDVAQAAMMNAVKGLEGYRGDASMFSWLCTICRNEINAYYRRQQRSVPVVAQDDDSIRPILESLEAAAEDDPDAKYQRREFVQLIQEVLDFLPQNYGHSLEWKYIEGLSVSEIATRLELSELAAQSLLARARGAFRDAILQLAPQLAQRGN